MVSRTNESSRLKLLTGFAEVLQQSMKVKEEENWLCLPQAVDPIAPYVSSGPDGLVFSVRLRGSLHGELQIALTREGAAVLLGRSGGTSAGTEEVWAELMDGVVKRLPKRMGDTGRFAFSMESHRTFVVGRAESQRLEGLCIGTLELRDSEGTSATFQVIASEELVQSLEAADWDAEARGSSREEELVQGAQIGRVIDVPLSVTLRFGQRNLRLREVLELNTGSMVDLDRQVEEPVDLMLGERVIARGEVVIVDGNYGLRVTEIVERAPVSLS